MGDIDDGVASQSDAVRRHEKIAGRRTENIDDSDNIGGGGIRDCGDTRDRHRPSNLSIVGPSLSEAFEQSRGDLAVPVGLDEGERFIRVPRQGSRHAPNAFQVIQIDRAEVRVMTLPVIPGTHQGMLQDWQLVHVIAHVVEQALHENRRDASAAHADRSGDHRLQFVTGVFVGFCGGWLLFGVVFV